jgi:hypothetical protein
MVPNDGSDRGDRAPIRNRSHAPNVGRRRETVLELFGWQMADALLRSKASNTLRLWGAPRPWVGCLIQGSPTNVVATGRRAF